MSTKTSFTGRLNKGDGTAPNSDALQSATLSVVPAEAPEAGTDDAFLSEVGSVLSRTSGPPPGETGNFNHDVSNGAVKVTGSTYSAYVYQRLQDAVPKMKAIHGVKSVDISAVQKL